MLKKMVSTMLMAAAMAQPVLAQPAACITSQEVHAGARFVVPAMISAVAGRCQPTLAANSYLANKGGTLAQRFAPASGDDALLKSLLAKTDHSGRMKELEIGTMKALVRDLMKAEVTRQLPLKSCGVVDKALALFDPMPADNLIGIGELIFAQVDAGRNRSQGARAMLARARFCPAP